MSIVNRISILVLPIHASQVSTVLTIWPTHATGELSVDHVQVVLMEMVWNVLVCTVLGRLPRQHKTLFGRQSNVFWTLWTSDGRQNNACFWDGQRSRRFYPLKFGITLGIRLNKIGKWILEIFFYTIFLSRGTLHISLKPLAVIKQFSPIKTFRNGNLVSVRRKTRYLTILSSML